MTVENTTQQRNRRAGWVLPATFTAVLLYLLLMIALLRPVVTTSVNYQIPERQTGRPVQALYQVEAAAQANGWTPELSWLAGDLWKEAGQPQVALPYWLAAAETIDDASLWQDIAKAATDAADWPAAVGAWDRVAALSPQNTAAQFQRGLLMAALDPEAALDSLAHARQDIAYQEISDALRAAITGAADDIHRRTRVALVFVERELWLYAHLAFEQMVMNGTDTPLVEAYYGLATDQIGGNGDAFVYAAVQRAPDDPQIRLLEGLHLRARRDDAGSIAAFTAAAALDPTSPALLAELGTAYRLAGDFASARHWYEQAVTLSNGAAPFTQLLQTLTTDEQEVLSNLGLNLDGENQEIPVTPEATADPA